MALPYLDIQGIPLLTATEIEVLREQLKDVRFAFYDRQANRLAGLDVMPAVAEGQLLGRQNEVASLILPL